MPNAPSELEAQCRSIPGKIFNFVLDNGAINVSTKSHSWIATRVSLIPISFMSQVGFIKVDEMETNSELYRLTQKNGTRNA
jgi:hypothetical protein